MSLHSYFLGIQEGVVVLLVSILRWDRPAAQFDRSWTLGGLISYVQAHHLRLKQ